MSDVVPRIREILRVIPTMRKRCKVRRNKEACRPLLYVGVAESDVVAQLAELVEADFGPPYKPAGEGAFWKNLLDGFVKTVGGVSRDQTLYRLELAPKIQLFCAFWPWGSDPTRTSVRLGLLCADGADERRLSQELDGAFC